jgi:stage II sporulation protein D
MIKKKLIFFLCFILIFSMVSGCRTMRRPAPDSAPEQKETKPSKEDRADDGEITVEEETTVEIPKQISTGENKEPKLRVYIAEQGKVKTMAMEEYIMGVVAAEMDPTWEKQALAAQAIKARTFTLQKIAEDGGVPARNADASSNIEEFQAYDPSRINDNVREAVEATRGLVAVYNDQFVRAWFHAYCGGQTATAPVGLNYQDDNPPYIQRVECPCFDGIEEDLRYWEKSYTTSRVRNVARQVSGKDPGNVTNFKVGEEEEGRAVTFLVNNVEVNAAEFRLAIGSTEFKSTIVNEISISGNTITFKGQGYGHGVGLCQWGAQVFARDQGKNAEEIITHYFRDIKIQKLWD